MYKVLICDDERDIVSALKIYLEAEGYETLCAHNGQEALDLLTREEVQLVLLKAGSYMATVTYASVGSHNADRLPELFFALDANASEAA